MIRLRVHRFWQIRRRYAVLSLVCFCVLGLVAAAYGQTNGLSQLIAALKDTDANVRKSAALALGVMKDPRAVEPLIAALQDPDAGVRQSAASALGAIEELIPYKDHRAVRPLIAALKDADAGVRQSAAKALPRSVDRAFAQEFSPAMDALIFALKDPDAGVRQSAVDALGVIDGPNVYSDHRAVKPLIAALQDPDAGVRKSAANALDMEVEGRSDSDHSVVDALIFALKDPDAGVRKSAASALGGIDGWSDSDHRAVTPLLAALRERDTVVVAGAISFFIKRGEPGSEDVLIAALNKFGDKEMPVKFANCENSKLELAASNWALRNGYAIQAVSSQYGSIYDRWGGATSK